ncbi:oxidoreductase [Aspergillus ambiguus]|uniref:isopenicillin N synthase family dioxygenase n=1 Tax=Aspergillus ambiguus TaxID=176160 RepID=UPI003CCD5BCA
MPKAPPVIDFGAYYHCDPSRKCDLVSQVREACREHGFFQIINHNVPFNLRDGILQQAQELFSLPLEVKEQYSKDAGKTSRGYERLRSQNFEKRGPGDLKEGFYFGKHLPLDHPSVIAGHFFQGPNQYPSEVRNPTLFREVIDAYHATMTKLAQNILEVLALTLGLNETWFREFNKEPVATLRLLRYPPQDSDESSFERGIGAHTDFGGITILLQDDKGGLQVWDQESSEWADVVPVRDALVVNLGNMMMRWTIDRYLSNLHRVINHSGETQYSVPFFYDGNGAFLVECIPSCLDKGGMGRYPAMTVQQILEGRYADTYGMALGKGSNQAAMRELFKGVEKAITG